MVGGLCSRVKGAGFVSCHGRRSAACTPVPKTERGGQSCFSCFPAAFVSSFHAFPAAFSILVFLFLCMFIFMLFPASLLPCFSLFPCFSLLPCFFFVVLRFTLFFLLLLASLFPCFSPVLYLPAFPAFFVFPPCLCLRPQRSTFAGRSQGIGFENLCSVAFTPPSLGDYCSPGRSHRFVFKKLKFPFASMSPRHLWNE